MSVSGRIKNEIDNLSPAERKIAEYILGNPDDVIKLTAAELAKLADSSPAAVIRLSKKINIGSFTTLKIMLSSDLTKDVKDHNNYEDIVSEEPLESIKEKLLTSALQSLNETSDQVDEGEVEALVTAIVNSQQMLLFGSGASNLVAQNIAQKWNRIGKSTLADNDLNELIPKIINANENDLVWIVSNSGESPEAVLAAKYAKEAGIKVASLTRFGDNSLAKLSDIAVHTSQPKESKNRIAATNSLLAQFMIIDIVFYYFVSSNFEETTVKLRESKNRVNNYKKIFLSK